MRFSLPICWTTGGVLLLFATLLSAAEPPADNPPPVEQPAAQADAAGLPNDPAAYRTPGSEKKTAPAGKPRKPKIVPDKETTHIVEPLRPDGYPDYFAALNEHCRRDVTAQTNAAVALLQAFGPEVIPAGVRSEYFQLLGAKASPAAGDYFVRSDEMVQRWTKGMAEPLDADSDSLLSQFALASEQPWAPSDYPMVAEWLALNAGPLARIEEAARRPRFYEPILPTNRNLPALQSATLPLELTTSEIISALQARAMLRVKLEQIDSAWDDLLACHRLVRTMAAMPLGQHAQSARTLDIGVCQTALKLLHVAHPTAQQVAQMQAKWMALPPLPSVVERIDLGDRYRFLDTVCLLDRQGPAALQQIFSDTWGATEDSALQKAVADALFDWREPLRLGNQWFDKQLAIARLADRKQRDAALQQAQLDLQKMARDADSPTMFAINWFTRGSAKAAFGRSAAATLIQMFHTDLAAALALEDQHALHRAFAQSGLALAAYRAEVGRYPERIEDVVPKYIAKLPRDVYSADAPLHYRRLSSGYTLYSLGPNGRDESDGVIDTFSDSDDVALSVSDPAAMPSAGF